MTEHKIQYIEYYILIDSFEIFALQNHQALYTTQNGKTQGTSTDVTEMSTAVTSTLRWQNV